MDVNSSQDVSAETLTTSAAEARRSQFLLINRAMYTFAMVAAVLTPNIENRWIIVAVIAVFALIEPVFIRFWKGKIHIAVYHCVMAATTAVVSPQAWYASILFFALNSRFAIDHERKPQAVINLVLIAVFTVGALFHHLALATWLPAIITLLAVFFAHDRSSRFLSKRDEAATTKVLALLDSMTTAFSIRDPKTQEHEWVTPSIESLTGWTPTEWMANTFASCVHPDDLKNLKIADSELTVGSEHTRFARFLTKSGNWKWIQLHTHVVKENDGTIVLRDNLSDATERISAQKKLAEEINLDHLTGLQNRQVLTRQIQDWLDEGRRFGLLMIDANRFKEINDTLGHTVGDEVIAQLGKRIDGSSRSFTCRLGGDEFAILVEDPERIELVADAVAESTEIPFRVAGMTLSVEVSIGGITAPDQASTLHELLSGGDTAMYEAKRLRRHFVRYDKSMSQLAAVELGLSSQVSIAVDRKQFTLHFQPQFDLKTKRITSYEGLARWYHPKRGVLSPGDFMPLMVLSHSFRRFTEQMIREACLFAARLEAMGQSLPVAVNVSALSLYEERFVSTVGEILKETEIDPSRLVIELTESEIMEDRILASDMINRLADLGVEISIDDFGTGHSSLERLIDLPVSEIKIDRRFVDQALESPLERVVVESIIDLARRLELRVVAEGVETVDQLNMLIDSGCTIGQGWVFSRDLPTDEALAHLIATNTDPARSTTAT